MTAEEFIKQRSVKLNGETNWVSESDALEAADKARREIAWNILKMVHGDVPITAINKFVCAILDY